MAYVDVPKDLNDIKTKVAFNLTMRQLVGFACSFLVGIPTYWVSVKIGFAVDVAVVLLLVAVFPVFFITFFNKDGMNFETYAEKFYLHKLYQPKKRYKKGQGGQLLEQNKTK